MKDVRGNEITAGSIVHCRWNHEGVDVDILCTAVRTRGRGIKFVTDDDKTYTVEQLESYEAILVIQENPNKKVSESSIDSKEIEIVNNLKSLGWTGRLAKSFGSIQVTIDL